MASAIRTALISTILPPMAAKAMEKVKAMVGNNVDGIVNIERDISKLQETLSMIQDIVQVAEEKQIDQQGKPIVFIQNWLRDVVGIAYEARDVLDDFITFSSYTIKAEEASNPVNTICSLMLSCFDVLSSDASNIPLTVLNRLEKDIRSVSERFDEKIKEAKTFATLKSVVGEGSKSVKNRRPKVGPFINKQRDGLFLGREDVKKGIMDKILHPSDDRVHVVVISGMGGIGKTTLAQSIYNDESIKKVPRRWLSVGVNKFGVEKVIREIVNDEKTFVLEYLQTKLVKKFRGKQVQRFFIVLDDVWDFDGNKWNLLFDPLNEVGKGGMIIITTREVGKEVCAAITDIQTTYNLEPLSEEDSWSIFESCAYANGKSDSTPDLECIGKKIVKKLNGHPLGLKVVGRSLLNKDSSIWTDFLESKFSEDDEVMSALRWSYNHLPSQLKTCFTYCSLFPKHRVLDKKVLVEMWMAQDFIQKEEQERPEDVGAQYFEQLVNASLLQCVDGKHVMHDLIHDLALLVSNGEFANANSSLTNDQMDKVRHITITPDDYSKIPRLCKMEKLLTLYTTYGETDHETADAESDDETYDETDIRVLVLQSFHGITDISDIISKFRHLRYLDVSQTRILSIPDSLCHLYNLQMLAAPPYTVLPRDIVNISSLRYVRASLSTCKGVGKLTSLQELSSIYVCEGENIRELGDMQILRRKLRIEGLENVSTLEGDVGALMEKQALMDELELHFKRWKLKFDKQLEKSTISEKVLDFLGCPPNLTYLQIVGYTGGKSPSWMVDGKHKFDKLQTLKLSNCSKLESLPPLGELTSLKHLSLRNVGVKRLGDEFYGKFTDSKVFFPSLESLYFSNMNEWEEWDDIIIENSSVSFFPRMTKLVIKDCAKLVSVLPVVKNLIMNAANLMTSLSRLEIRNCNGLKRLQLDALVSSKSLKLEVEDCKSLRSLTINIHGLDSLKHLRINCCPKLELAFEDGSSSSSSCSGNSVAIPLHYIYTDNTQVFRTLLHHELVSLESLEIRNLGGFENFDETEANNFCKLRSLKRLCISQCEDLMSSLPDFYKLSSLEELVIDVCSQLQSLPPDFHKLSSLKYLDIYDCPQLQSLPPDFHKLSSLKNLTICDCPQLQSPHLDFHKLSSLEQLYICNCSQLQSLLDDVLPSLTYLKIIHCEDGFPKISRISMTRIRQRLIDEKIFNSLCNISMKRCVMMVQKMTGGGGEYDLAHML